MKTNLFKILFVAVIALFLGACVATQEDLQRAMDSQSTQVAQQIGEAVASIPKVDSDEIAKQVIAAMPTAEPTPEPTLEPTPDRVLEALEAVVDRLDLMGSGQSNQPGNVPSVVATGNDMFTDFEAFIAAVALPCPDDAESCIPLTARELSFCPDEENCIRALREKDEFAVIIPYFGQNPTSCMQDGWMHSPEDRAALGRTSPPEAVGSGVPAGYVGLIEGMTLRPCPVP